MLTSRVNTSNLFRIAHNMYGMIVGQVSLYFGQNINHSNKLILFDSEGQFYETLDLSTDDQNYSVIANKENEFEIVSNYETRRFKIYAP
jgi:cytochrome oxidase Cu insertion factor (SCO1/SenC/PrrC family)